MLLDFASEIYTVFVHTEYVKNITFRADEGLIEQARSIARSQGKTLSEMFREWLRQLTCQSGDETEVMSLMRRMRHVKAGRRFTRDETNRR